MERKYEITIYGLGDKPMMLHAYMTDEQFSDFRNVFWNTKCELYAKILIDKLDEK